MSVQQPPLALNGVAPSPNDGHPFDAIKGRPELHWRGKRPFAAGDYLPAQLREIHGPEVDAWRNKLYWGDNLQVMRHLLKTYRGRVQLVYIDPPFDSKADYKRTIRLNGHTVQNDRTAFEDKQYTDIWTNDEYLQYMFERLVLLHRLLADTGCIYVHCDHRKEHHLRCLLDDIFGPNNFLNIISWRSQVARGAKVNAFYLPYSTQFLLAYAKNRTHTRYNRPRKRIELTADEAARDFQQDEHGFFRTSDPGSYSFDSLCALHAQGRLYAPYDGTPIIDHASRRVYASNGGNIAIKYYLIDLGNGKYAAERAIDNIWDDIPGLGTTPGEDRGYPTQKTEALLRRIIEMSSDPGDLVFDAFMGSGVTPITATKLGRRFIGSDINLASIHVTTKALLQLAEEQSTHPAGRATQSSLLLETDAEPDPTPTTLYTGFELYTVNDYDFFRNPLEAREILLDHLEIQRLPAGHLFDGEKDGRLVKLMPVNRIATRADLNELIAGLDYKAFAHRQAEHPHRPVERITLVCLGHEPDLGPALKQEVKAIGFDLDVTVIDILREHTDLRIKRESEAKVAIRNGHLVIDRFYPMNLLQKLSLPQEQIQDWRQLVDAIFIDWNYDGVIFQPAVTDLPDEDQLVAGRYPVPATAGTVRIRITDLLSDSLELELHHA